MRVFSYNILIGGTHRVEQLTRMIRAGQPDVVGLIEAIDEQVVRELAERLGMQYRLSGRALDAEGWQAALLSHLPIISVEVHSNAILKKQPLLEVTLEETDGQPLTLFVAHLTADFSKGRVARRARREEIQEILRIMAKKRGENHVMMGDFNSLAPGEHLKGSLFLRYVIDPTLYYRLQPDESIRPPDLNFVLPPRLRLFKPLLELIPKSRILSSILDKADSLYAPSGGIDLLHEKGYIDCFRAIHPSEQGFTWPAPLPSGRVDFIFASSELAGRLTACEVILEGEGIQGNQASDHLPVVADFSPTTSSQPELRKRVSTYLL
jgi:endonuclease/exonuclease/phosphatase family metal-dependent hydrolase